MTRAVLTKNYVKNRDKIPSQRIIGMAKVALRHTRSTRLRLRTRVIITKNYVKNRD